MRAFHSAFAGVLLFCSAITLDALLVDRPRLSKAERTKREAESKRLRVERRQLRAKKRQTKMRLKQQRKLMNEDMKKVAGIPVYGYHEGLEVARKTKKDASATDETATWIVNFKKDIPAVELTDLCSQVFTPCHRHGHMEDPNHPGLPFLVTEASAAELEAHLDEANARGSEAESVEHDKVVGMADAHLDFSEALADHERRAARRAATWGLDRVGRDSAPATGSGVHAYVIDTGIRVTHEDFTGRAIPTFDATQSYTDNKCPCDDTACAADGHGHGTHCASSLGGAQYGVAPDCRIHGMKVFRDDGTGGYLSWIMAAVDVVLTAGQRPAVTSMSLSGWGQSGTIIGMVNSLSVEGIAVVAAAGNHGGLSIRYWPGNAPTAITVGAVNAADKHLSFSNDGDRVDILAPGHQVIAASNNDDTSTSSKSGTSMACPHVAGAVAILLSMNPSLSVAEQTQELLDKAESGSIDMTNAASGTPNLLLQVGNLSGTAGAGAAAAGAAGAAGAAAAGDPPEDAAPR